MHVLKYMIALTILFGSSSFAADYMVQADSLFELRNSTFNDSTLLSDPAQVDAAMQLYHTAMDSAQSPEQKLEAAWKMLRGYYFKGTYTESDKGKRRDIYKKGIDFSKSMLEEFPESVELHCWSGILWGYLGEVQGILASARKGVAGKVKYFAEKTIELDDTYLNGGGYRMLGTVNLKAPKVPLILGWPSKKKSVTCLEKANQIGPNNLYTMYYLAGAYIATGEKDKAAPLLMQIMNTDSIVHEIAVDATAKHVARLLYDKQFGESEK
ncbi:hypothetical protein HQ585_15075 [candidate division KSB1 bacterium]|nr:hypothetical protein [candidate division KSB1 bacterium]